MTVAPQIAGPSTPSGGPAPSLDLDEHLADIGDRIRAERHARGWTQNALARQAGLSLATIKRIEEGQTTLRGFLLTCTALQVDMGHLLSREWRMPPPYQRRLLTTRQVEMLRVVADGRPLSVAAPELGITPARLASELSVIYRRLGVADAPRGRKRPAAVEVASAHGLLNAA